MQIAPTSTFFFWKREAMELPNLKPSWRQVPTAPEFWFFPARLVQRKRAHGHILVFQVVEETIELLRVFHTSQDWVRRFSDPDDNVDTKG